MGTLLQETNLASTRWIKSGDWVPVETAPLRHRVNDMYRASEDLAMSRLLSAHEVEHHPGPPPAGAPTTAEVVSGATAAAATAAAGGEWQADSPVASAALEVELLPTTGTKGQVTLTTVAQTVGQPTTAAAGGAGVEDDEEVLDLSPTASPIEFSA